MEIPLSQESIHMSEEDRRCQTEFTEVRSSQSIQVSSAECDYVGPPTSEGHNSFVRAPFRVFLDSMESPLSQESIHMHVEDNRCHTEVLDQARPVQVSSARCDYM